jgi:hypothetical protein
MTAAATNEIQSYVESSESRRPTRTILVFMFLGWVCETTFLFFGMFMFPDLHAPLISRLIWTQLLCGTGMGAAVGALAYMAGSGFKQGSRAALIITGIVAAGAYFTCGEVCYHVEMLPGMNFFGGQEMPFLFRLKGDIGGMTLGLVGSWLLNTKKGLNLLNKIPFLR